jgi:hypothetical protein
MTLEAYVLLFATLLMVFLHVRLAYEFEGLKWRLRHQQHRLDALASEQARARAAHELRRGRRRT